MAIAGLEPSKGVIKDDYTGTITAAKFMIDPQYNADTLVLEVKFIDDEDGEEVRELWPCGKDWDTEDNGETAEHAQNKDAFHIKSIIGIILNEICKGDKGTLAKCGETMLRLHGEVDQRWAKIWVGLRFHMQKSEVKIPGLKDEDGNPVTTERNMPVEFLGVAEGKASKNGASTKVSSSASSSKTSKPKVDSKETSTSSQKPSSGAFSLEDIPGPILKKLQKLATLSDDSTEFLSDATSVPGVEEVDGLMEALIDGAVYAALTE